MVAQGNRAMSPGRLPKIYPGTELLRDALDTPNAALPSCPPRRVTRNKLHKLEDIMMITLCAVLCGFEDWVAYAARPRCMVDRSWMRVALNALKEKLNVEHGGDDVGISFDGRILAFSRPGWVVPVPAEGALWPSRYQIQAENFSKFPSRLMSE